MGEYFEPVLVLTGGLHLLLLHLPCFSRHLGPLPESLCSTRPERTAWFKTIVLHLRILETDLGKGGAVKDALALPAADYSLDVALF